MFFEIDHLSSFAIKNLSKHMVKKAKTRETIFSTQETENRKVLVSRIHNDVL